MLTGPQFSADSARDPTLLSLRESLEQTRKHIASAALRYGRDQTDIHLLAVSKMQSVARIRAVAECGQRDFGENYVQEALPKLTALADLGLTWHFIGQLQANKTRAVAENFAWVHTIDRERIAIRLSEQRSPHAAPLNICIQVRLEDEPGKGGVAPDEIVDLAMRIRGLPRLALRGLMCVPPPRESFEEQRALFARLAQLRDTLNARGLVLDTLSMGMSADMDAAIAAGATWVRIGAAIFGARPPA